MISVAIVEDDEIFSTGVQTLINTTSEFRCVAAYANAEEALARLPALAPNVVLMDINLPNASGVECVRKLKPLLPDTEILMLTALDDGEHICQAIQAGATGYLIKQGKPEELLTAIQELHNGGSPISAGIARKVMTALRQLGPAPNETDNLSQREREVLDSLAKGHRYKEVATDLNLSPHTVRTHVQHIYKKLHVQSRSAALKKHRQSGS
jgi:DNA-binding NarL/FixJ family response regulator